MIDLKMKMPGFYHRNKRCMRSVPWLIVILLLCPQINAAKPDSEHAIRQADALFTSLAGSWDGLAIETPVGSMEYAINFHVCEDDIIAGVAKTRASLHYWRFWKQDKALRLTFMSTFQGNRTPTELQINTVQDNTVWFHAPKLELLTVSITLSEPHIDIRIFHHHQPHVYIRLTRGHSNMTEQERLTSMAMSCQELPPYKIAKAVLSREFKRGSAR